MSAIRKLTGGYTNVRRYFLCLEPRGSVFSGWLVVSEREIELNTEVLSERLESGWRTPIHPLLPLSSIHIVTLLPLGLGVFASKVKGGLSGQDKVYTIYETGSTGGNTNILRLGGTLGPKAAGLAKNILLAPQADARLKLAQRVPDFLMGFHSTPPLERLCTTIGGQTASWYCGKKTGVFPSGPVAKRGKDGTRSVDIRNIDHPSAVGRSQIWRFGSGESHRRAAMLMEESVREREMLGGVSWREADRRGAVEGPTVRDAWPPSPRVASTFSSPASVLRSQEDTKRTNDTAR
ncbi:hypothetical protein B0H13DRAFT_1883560 [Mycena leptocephala]|nr:hypothetical protein B0H13DRAFT_1883560 [Mycena leptocephala]